MKNSVGVQFATLMLLASIFNGKFVYADYTVEQVRGMVTLDDKEIKKNQKIPDGSILDSRDAEAFVQVKNEYSKFAAKGEFKIELPEKSGKEVLGRLLEGKVRMNLFKGRLKDRFRFRTPTSVVGVRGTEFTLSFLPLLNESEVICFESEIDFASADGKSRQLVKAGQWGGLGGRFGQKIAAPITLPKAAVDHFNQELAFE